MGSAGPVVRSAVFEQSPAVLETSRWHEELVKQTFDALSKTCTGEVGLDQLESSFAMMKIPLDEATFCYYAAKLLPRGTDCLTASEFMDFHKVVWLNQPANVRRYAGDPALRGGCVFPGSAGTRRLSRSSSVPSGASLRELRSNEEMLRSAFKRYESSPGHLHRSELPALFHDVGLDLGVDNDLGLKGSNRLHKFLASELECSNRQDQDALSIHEVVEMQNKYIATLEEVKADRKPQNFLSASTSFQPDDIVKQYMEISNRSRPSTAVKRQAALEEKVAIVDEFAAVADAYGNKARIPLKARTCAHLQAETEAIQC